ncbi:MULTISPECIES: DeoR/GlpR family DNA-binding transcription regulator [Chryseobacterium]|uniref:Transcriptional regulator, DeoR family n=1 Tax=Chryseobacterium polytrichastri TaxID=1302687 RepID=A0A1M7JUZ2_9FLAO|nr:MULTISPECIES: DeoR/GlpR family DNA-binding transcription regulator [Chryseobacterium]KPH11378.1 transcriptional regulator [Chryseobacterium sp. ERMR1:04]SHM56804.1 transcriptional regulator, DeoR family [Chryseobacterium polytrichastri]
MEKLIARHSDILKVLDEKDYVLVQDLCEKFNVSSVTIRKDLNYLESLGLLFRNHGGASKYVRYAYEKNVDEKENINVEAKQSIAKAALQMIQENDCIILASGTTMHYLARMLVNFGRLTVLTSSLRVALELCNNPNINIIQLGGEVRKSSTSIVGSISETILKQFSCNKLFLGVDGIDLDFGISTSNAAEAHLNQLMIECSDKVVILADSSKLNKKGFGRIATLDQIDCLITDDGILKEDRKGLEEVGVSVITK